MSTQTYRDQVTRLVSDLAGLETKHAKAHEGAARERAAAERIGSGRTCSQQTYRTARLSA